MTRVKSAIMPVVATTFKGADANTGAAAKAANPANTDRREQEEKDTCLSMTLNMRVIRKMSMRMRTILKTEPPFCQKQTDFITNVAPALPKIPAIKPRKAPRQRHVQLVQPLTP